MLDSNRLVTRSLLMLLLAALALVGCGGSGAAEGEGGDATSGGEASEYQGPVGSEDVEGGTALYEDHCGDCHPGGEADVGPSLLESPHGAAAMRQQIREGSGRMRPFSEKRLSSEDLEKVLAYLVSINAVQ